MKAKIEYIKQVTDLVKNYCESDKPELFIDSLNNYDRHNLRIALELRKIFPVNWQKKL
jgi:hypothetical protein